MCITGIPWYPRFGFTNFQFNGVYNSILFSSALVLISTRDLRGFSFGNFLCLTTLTAKIEECLYLVSWRPSLYPIRAFDRWFDYRSIMVSSDLQRTMKAISFQFSFRHLLMHFPAWLTFGALTKSEELFFYIFSFSVKCWH